ncbi:MAG TPA: hypothetical protein VGK94_12000 [Candidatus Polarisedimenticolia bacterium]
MATRGTLPEVEYTAAVCGDGRVLPITATVGRRLVAEIDPLSREGRELLTTGVVKLYYDDGARAEKAPIQEILDRLRSGVKGRRDAHADLPGWAAHHDRVLRSIGRMKRTLKP